MARIQPLHPSEWSDEARAALKSLVPPVVRHPVQRVEGRPKGLNALGTFARYPALARGFHTFNGHVLMGTSLPARLRELVILRVASRRRCAYEWAQHAVLAGDAGLTADEVQAASAVEVSVDDQAWSAVDRALLAATDELIADARISDTTWSSLTSLLGEEELMDLVFTVGAYEVLAMAFNSFEVDLDADLQGGALGARRPW